MTRREFVEKNHPEEIVGIHAKFVSGCPGMFQDLVALDPSCDMTYYGRCRCKATMTTCDECWNQEIPGTTETRPHGFRLEKKEKPAEELELSIKKAIDRAVCDCDTCAHQELCRFEHQFRGITKEMYRHCIEETTRYNIPELGIQMRPLHCKRYEPSPAIEKLNTAVFQPKAQNPTDELIRKIFDEEPKESK